MEGKVCSRCGEWKPFSEFHKNKSKKDGYHTDCKVCRKKDYKQSYSKNKEKYIEYSKNYYMMNWEKVRERQKDYHNSEKGREVWYRKSIKRRSYKNEATFTPFKRKEILDRDNWTCQCCGSTVHDKHTGNWNTPDKAHIDHIIPISKGGNSEPSNLQILCRTCNLSKSDSIVV